MSAALSNGPAIGQCACIKDGAVAFLHDPHC